MQYSKVWPILYHLNLFISIRRQAVYVKKPVVIWGIVYIYKEFSN